MQGTVEQIAKTLASEYWNGKPWSQCTEREKQDCLIEAKSIYQSEHPETKPLNFGALSYNSKCQPCIEWFSTQEEAECSLAEEAQGWVDSGERVPNADDWGIVKLVKSGSMKAEPFDGEYFQLEAVNA